MQICSYLLAKSCCKTVGQEVLNCLAFTQACAHEVKDFICIVYNWFCVHPLQLQLRAWLRIAFKSSLWNVSQSVHCHSVLWKRTLMTWETEITLRTVKGNLQEFLHAKLGTLKEKCFRVQTVVYFGVCFSFCFQW